MISGDHWFVELPLFWDDRHRMSLRVDWEEKHGCLFFKLRCNNHFLRFELLLSLDIIISKARIFQSDDEIFFCISILWCKMFLFSAFSNCFQRSSICFSHSYILRCWPGGHFGEKEVGGEGKRRVEVSRGEDKAVAGFPLLESRLMMTGDSRPEWC